MKKRKKKKEQADLTQLVVGRATSGGGVKDEWRRQSGRCGGAEPSNPFVLSLSTSFSVSYYRESWIMCWNQVESEKKKVEKESWRKKERGRFWKVESREKKRERIRIYGNTCVVEKNQEKKKNVWMIEERMEK